MVELQSTCAWYVSVVWSTFISTYQWTSGDRQMKHDRSLDTQHMRIPPGCSERPSRTSPVDVSALAYTDSRVAVIVGHSHA